MIRKLVIKGVESIHDVEKACYWTSWNYCFGGCTIDSIQ